MTTPTVTRLADTLVFTGALERGGLAVLWRQAQPLRAGITRLDLQAVSRVDSAGLALLAELAAPGVSIDGSPDGLSELRDAYRLDDGLRFGL